MYVLKITKARVACLIGKNGQTKKLIEKRTNTCLRVSKEGDVEIQGEGYEAYVCEKVIKAIGRGFNPLIAMNLTRDDYALEIIDIKDFSGNSKKKFVRLKSRLIGTKGKARRVIEKMTGCNLCIYGKTVSIIGEYSRLNVAYIGVQKLISGSPHGNVYGYLEREMKKLSKNELI